MVLARGYSRLRITSTQLQYMYQYTSCVHNLSAAILVLQLILVLHHLVNWSFSIALGTVQLLRQHKDILSEIVKQKLQLNRAHIVRNDVG